MVRLTMGWFAAAFSCVHVFVTASVSCEARLFGS